MGSSLDPGVLDDTYDLVVLLPPLRDARTARRTADRTLVDVGTDLARRCDRRAALDKKAVRDVFRAVHDLRAVLESDAGD